MDEPTGGLDPNQIHDVRVLIRQLGKTKTILLSTHILQEVEAVADHVILIHEGRVIFDGTPQAMAAGGGLEEAFYRMTGKLAALSCGQHPLGRSRRQLPVGLGVSKAQWQHPLGARLLGSPEKLRGRCWNEPDLETT